MSTGRKILFSVSTLVVLLGVLEAAARLVFWRLGERAFIVRKASGEKVLRNDAINFMKQADGTFGYTLKPGFDRGGTYINADGFPQRETVPLTRSPGTIRLAALGESTTQGHNVDTANYPRYLHRLIREYGRGYRNVEMINGGVAGWISDQVALWAEKKVSAYRPDTVVLYVGWNDFQSYDPFSSPPADSYFDYAYGSARLFVQSSPLKIVALASAAYGYYSRKAEIRRQRRTSAAGKLDSTHPHQLRYKSAPAVNYQFYLRSMDRIINTFRDRDPKVRLAVCTLVGRWPYGTEADFKSDQGATWWMKLHGLGPAQAAAALNRLNDLIRVYAKTRGLLLIDAEKRFSDLDRGKLQHDFAHFSAEGYELLAEVMYDALRSASVVNGEPSTRLEQLWNKYRVKRQPHGLTRTTETN